MESESVTTVLFIHRLGYIITYLLHARSLDYLSCRFFNLNPFKYFTPHRAYFLNLGEKTHEGNCLLAYSHASGVCRNPFSYTPQMFPCVCISHERRQRTLLEIWFLICSPMCTSTTWLSHVKFHPEWEICLLMWESHMLLTWQCFSGFPNISLIFEHQSSHKHLVAMATPALIPWMNGITNLSIW